MVTWIAVEEKPEFSAYILQWQAKRKNEDGDTINMLPSTDLQQRAHQLRFYSAAAPIFSDHERCFRLTAPALLAEASYGNDLPLSGDLGWRQGHLDEIAKVSG